MKAIERARLAATRAHAGQTYDIYPYTYHLEQVLKVAQDLGYDETIQVSCLLHDIMEDCDLSYNDIKNNFGEEVAEIVYCVTDELGRNRQERKEKTYPKIKANWKATVVKICDRIANAKQSHDFNPKLYKMYQKEHLGFIKQLLDENHPSDVDKAWLELGKILG